MEIEIKDTLLKPGEHIVVQRRSENEVECEELFRYTFPSTPNSTAIVKRIEIGHKTLNA